MRLKKRIFDWLTQRFAQAEIAHTILVAGAPRSGTTWLAELVRELPDYKLINEPLRLNTNPKAQAAGFDWRTRVEPHEERPELERHLRDILRGQVELGPAWHFQASHPIGKLLEHVTHRRTVVKFCRAGRMLHWMHRVLPCRGSVFIVRHPCAVIASMLNMGDNWQPSDDRKRQRLVEFVPPYVPDRIAQRLQLLPDQCNCWTGRLALKWSLDHYFALHWDAPTSGDYPWVLTTYEQLLIREVNELERIVNALGGTVTETMKKRLSTPANHASESLNTTSTHKQLAKWRQRLSPKQIDAILRIVNAFDMGFYTDALHPDYGQLNVFQRPEHRWSSSSTFSTERPDT